MVKMHNLDVFLAYADFDIHRECKFKIGLLRKSLSLNVNIILGKLFFFKFKFCYLKLKLHLYFCVHITTSSVSL